MEQDQFQQRLEKLSLLREQGRDPYAVRKVLTT